MLNLLQGNYQIFIVKMMQCTNDLKRYRFDEQVLPVAGKLIQNTL